MFSDILSKDTLKEKITKNKDKIIGKNEEVGLGVATLRLTFMAGQYMNLNKSKIAVTYASHLGFLNGLVGDRDVDGLTFLKLLEESDEKLNANVKKLKMHLKANKSVTGASNLANAVQNNLNVITRLLEIHNLAFAEGERINEMALGKIDKDCTTAKSVINKYHKASSISKTENSEPKTRDKKTPTARSR